MEPTQHHAGPSLWGWAFLLLALLVGAALRFGQLGELPPGLYRDEAYNGLDALQVLEGNHSLFFQANNGREPAYIYLTAIAVGIFGQTTFAVRLAAAVAGTLTTALTFRLARSWFGRRVGLFSAWLWALTLWPVHLSRIGLRPILLVPALTLALWLATRAYRRRRAWLWAVAGAAYGATFYTYLAARFTPILLFLLFSYIVLKRQGRRLELARGLAWFGAGAILILAPLALVAARDPAILVGRADQVSILNASVHGGSLPRTLARHTGQALALFLWRGDTILRHNPAGRPLFGPFMALPFAAGLGWCLWNWRRPTALALLLWLFVMLGPTILAEDPPHFLRSAGILPAATIVPAIGLSKIWVWPKLAGALRRGLVLFLTLGTLIMTIGDYAAYGQQPDTAYLFESAARSLARQINGETAETTVLLDRRFWEGWPSIPFLVKTDATVVLFRPEDLEMPTVVPPLAVYAWPHGPLAFIRPTIRPPAVVSAALGPLARNDLEEEAYPLYVRYAATPPPPALTGPGIAEFGKSIELVAAEAEILTPTRLVVDLYWRTTELVEEQVVAFVHVVGDAGIVSQHDSIPAHGFWPAPWWQRGLIVHDRHFLDLDPNRGYAGHHIEVGLYGQENGERLPVMGPDGQPTTDGWRLEIWPEAYEER